jgi:hypothetical protein
MDFVKLDKDRSLEFVYALEAEGLSVARRSSRMPGELLFFE